MESLIDDFEKSSRKLKRDVIDRQSIDKPIDNSTGQLNDKVFLDSCGSEVALENVSCTYYNYRNFELNIHFGEQVHLKILSNDYIEFVKPFSFIIRVCKSCNNAHIDYHDLKNEMFN